MSIEMRAQYKAMERDLMIELQNDKTITATIALTKILRLQEITAGRYLDIKNNEKINELYDILEENGDKNIIIWCRFKGSIKAISAALSEKEISHCIMDGDTVNRQEIIDDFQAGKYRVFVGQIRTGGIGITLTKSDLTVYYENTFSLEDRLQSEARNHRIGQKNNVLYIDLVYKDSIDEIVLMSISKKQDVAYTVVSCFKGGEYK
jgi:SNF2 family DNA or RNA helicase